MQYERPIELEQAVALLSRDNWIVLAGGTDFFPALNGRRAKENILDISAIKTLREITNDGDHWRIGALATWSDIISAKLPTAFDGLKQAAREVGSIQIQNKATVAGNICNASPAADGVPPLLTLDAIIEVVSSTRTRQIPLQDFILGNRDTDLQPDEMVSAVLIPASSANGKSSFIKLGARKYLVISISMVAVVLQSDHQETITCAAVSVGACSSVAKRLPRLEADLIGRKITDSFAGFVTDNHLEVLSPLDDVRAPADYRMKASKVLLERAIELAANDKGGAVT